MMNRTSWRSGYMPLSGAASWPSVMINLVSRHGHHRIFLATFSWPNNVFSQLICTFQATRRRNLGLMSRPENQEKSQLPAPWYAMRGENLQLPLMAGRIVHLRTSHDLPGDGMVCERPAEPHDACSHSSRIQAVMDLACT